MNANQKQIAMPLKAKKNVIFSKAFLMITSIVVLLTGCTFSPWKAWRYNYKLDFNGYPYPPNLPSQEKFSSLYINGAFVGIRVMAHDETLYSGKPPYLLIISVFTDNGEHKSVTFHSISILSSLNKTHVVSPIMVNKLAEKTGNLAFPVIKQLEPIGVYNPTPEIKKFTEASLWSDDDLNLDPKEGEIIQVIIDVEVHKSNTSERKKVEYELFPHKEGGPFKCISV